MGGPEHISQASIAALKRLARARPSAERCELCAQPLPPRHAHLLQPEERRIVCACDACAILFEEEGARRYRRVPRDVYALPDLAMEDLQWEALSLPVNLAFFFPSSVAKRIVACYPSPGGATESLLDLAAWEEVAALHPRLQSLQTDVQALLANRLAQPPEYYIVPIDRCYELSGIVRKHWSGFTGGDEVWKQVSAFFDGLREEAIGAGATHA